MYVISRSEAKKQGLSTYFTGSPCKYAHVSKRRVSNGYCLECKKEARNKPESKEKEKLNKNHTLKST